MADWGGGTDHPEFLVDRDKQQATEDLYGPDEKTPVANAAKSIRLMIVELELVIELLADPQEGHSEGKASRFVGTDPGLSVVRECEGTPNTGAFEEDERPTGAASPTPQSQRVHDDADAGEAHRRRRCGRIAR